MASNSDMFDYLLPSKRRKYSVSSENNHKNSEQIDNLTQSIDFVTEINHTKDKQQQQHDGFNTQEHNKITSQIFDNYTPNIHMKLNEADLNETLKYENSDLSSTNEGNNSHTVVQNEIYFEDCVNELMSKNSFLLPINQNHKPPECKNFFEDDEDDDEDEDEGDDDNTSDEKDDFDDEDEDDDEEDENFNPIQSIENMSESDMLKMKARSIRWVRKQILAGVHPLEIRSLHLPHINDMLLWSIITRAISDPPRRAPISHINSIDDVVKLLHNSKNILVLTGAGVSVSCGIPDFRSRDGIYARLAIDYPDLPDPQAMFCISYFNQDPRPFFKFAREIYPGQFKPSPCHRFIKLLDEKNKLLRNYTQNIDTLEQISGIKNVIECHGSFATATCTKCRHKVSATEIRDDIFEQRIPLCQICNPNTPSPSSAELNADESYKSLVWRGIMKPDIVFFGEDLPEQFHSAIDNDRKQCDLLIVIGSSLKVRPVALIPNSIPSRIPQILINRESLSHLDFDVELLGNADTIINQLCHMLGEDWKDVCCAPKMDECEKFNKPTTSPSSASSSPNSNSDSNDVDYQSVMHISIDSGFDSISSHGSSTHSTLTSPRRLPTEAEYPNNFTPEDSLSNQTTQQSVQIVKQIEIQSMERHMSIDSAKDSGISGTSSSSSTYSEDENNSNCKSVADLLPPNTYYRLRHRRYIFPGAEISWDSDDESSENDEDDSNFYDEDTTNFSGERENSNLENQTNITLTTDNDDRGRNLLSEENNLKL